MTDFRLCGGPTKLKIFLVWRFKKRVANTCHQVFVVIASM